MIEVPVEFIGGPWDGEVRGFDCVPPPEVHLAKLPPNILAMKDDEPIQVRHGVYRGTVRGTQAVYVWEGEL